MRVMFLTILLASVTNPCPARVFTDKNGRQIDAELVSRQGDQIRIRRVDGKEFSLSASTLSPPDQQFVKDWQPPPPKPMVPAPAASPDTRKFQRMVEDVLFVVEQGNKEPYSKRWTSLPRLVVSSTDPALQKHAETSFADLCKETGLSDTTPGDGEIIVSIGPSKELSRAAREVDVQISLSSGHSYWTWWDDDRRLMRAVVYLCSDRVSGDEALDTLLADLIGAFGFPSQSSEFDDCCLSKRGSPQPVLTPVDRKVINFCYKHVPPGTKAYGLKKIFKDHWQP